MTEPSPLITRRRSLGILGAGSAGLLVAGIAHPGRATAKSEGDDYVADATNACSTTAEQEEGPFYVAVDDVRSDIVVGQVGLPLDLSITIISELTCKPLKHAAVDIWMANGDGVYSDIASESTTGKTYLRGVQFTDKHGQVHFSTIFPGHYSGRTTHIHARIHVNSQDRDAKLTGGHVCHTGQMFPPDAVNTEVYKLSPYSAESATIVTHAQDHVYTDQHGSEGLMKITARGSHLKHGLAASVTMSVNPKATPALIGATSTGTPRTGPGPGGSAPIGSAPGGTPPTGTITAPTTTT